MDDERSVTIWLRWPSETWWVIERSYPLRYARDVLGVGLDESERGGRVYRAFERGTDPNAT